MKFIKFILRVILILMSAFYFTKATAQPNNNFGKSSFDDKWKTVAQFEKADQPKSALAVVEEIYQLAKKENNPAQQFKSVLHIMKFKTNFEEDAYKNVVYFIEKEIKTERVPQRQLLSSFLADVYLNYFQENNYAILERSSTGRLAGEDFTTWDVTAFSEKIISLLKESLKQPGQLKIIPVDILDAVLEKGTINRNIRPTLFDFLAFRAIDIFYKNNEFEVIHPVEEFNIDGRQMFVSLNDFLKIPVKTTDTNSYKFLALKTLTDILRFHIDDGNKEAVIYADLDRLDYIKNNSDFPEKDDTYYSILNRLFDENKALPASAEILYCIANQVYDGFRPKPADSNMASKKLALSICQKAIDNYAGSPGADKCSALKSTILLKSYDLRCETILPSMVSEKFLLEYKNVNTAYVHIIPVDEKMKSKIKDASWDQNKIYQLLTSVKAVYTNSCQLPLPEDYEPHSTELLIPPLKYGYYAILVSVKPDFSINGNNIAYSFIQISDLKPVMETEENGDRQRIYVLNAVSGKPVPHVKIELFKNTDKQREKILEISTDSAGFAGIDNSILGWNYYDVVMSNGQDQYFYSTYFSHKYLPENNEEKKKTFFFTDRSIYRPGQTVYFKGITVKSNSDETNSEVLKDFKTTIILYDPNVQKIADIDVITNEFGAFHGSFVIPSTGMTGSYQLFETNGSEFFSVEEYKRPNFEVKIDNISGIYKLNDDVEISGSAVSYSGIPISSAKVKYRVVRNAMFNFWFDWWRPRPASPEKEILNGSIVSDADGKYRFVFKLMPDQNIQAKDKPEFTYTIYIDVIDINGETHSNSAVIKAGYVSLEGNINADDWLSLNKPIALMINAKNLNGVSVSLKGKLSVYRVAQPAKALREKHWAAPDQFVIQKQEYNKLFPDDPYKSKETELSGLTEELVYSSDANTNEKTVIDPAALKIFSQGTFEFVFQTKDTFGNTVEFRKRSNLFDEQSGSLVLNEFSYIIPVRTTVQPGEKAVFIWGSAINAYGIMNIVRNEKIIRSYHLILSKNQKTIEIPIEEADRGNICLNLVSVIQNRIYNYSFIISVPWENKMLNVQLVSFRSKIEPDKKESWKIRITGPGKDKIIADVLAGMYDASLDAIKPHSWDFYVFKSNKSDGLFVPFGNDFSTGYSANFSKSWNKYYEQKTWDYDNLNMYGLFSYAQSERYYALDESVIKKAKFSDKSESSEVLKVKSVKPEIKTESEKEAEPQQPVQIRKNLNETAFFYPSLSVNKDGDYELNFTSPEALTKWKLMVFAHTSDLKQGHLEDYTVTQKQLMVTPNNPRFLRTGDTLYYTSKLSNLSDSNLKGKIELKILDPYSLNSVAGQFKLNQPSQDFEIKKAENKSFSWKITIPARFDAVVIQVVATSNLYSDGEEIILPVFPDKILVTESMPMFIRERQNKTFKFEKFINSSISSKTLQNRSLTLEMTPNPAWYAVMALPYLMESTDESSEQLFNRLYANSISYHLSKSNPAIKKVFDSWKNSSSLISPLEKNSELKSVLLSETPWMIDGENETEQMKRTGMLFDENNLNNSIAETIQKLMQAQLATGAWPWFKGMYPNRYITQYIITGFGHLKSLGVKFDSIEDVSRMIDSAISYTDREIINSYEFLLKNNIKTDKDNLGYEEIQYLYARSFYINKIIPESSKKAFDYWKSQAAKYWTGKGLMAKAMIALALKRFGDKTVPSKIISSLKEYSVTKDETGMYWKDNVSSYNWWNAPVETQSLLIEAFDEITGDSISVDNMRIWLLCQKQVQAWPTTIATADACYSLMLKGTGWLKSGEELTVYLNEQKLETAKEETEAGTGYFKTKWTGNEIKPEYGNVRLDKKDKGIAWGALHWQYFEQPDKITPSETPLKVKKEIYLVNNTPHGQVLEKIDSNHILKTGDLVKVRIIVNSDRQMEFIHLKDMRASALEPVETISGYEYQDELGYYKSIRDASVNYFFDNIPKGQFVFEYSLRVSQSGTFQNGITTIQCMYAPQFNSHSTGKTLKIGN